MLLDVAGCCWMLLDVVDVVLVGHSKLLTHAKAPKAPMTLNVGMCRCLFRHLATRIHPASEIPAGDDICCILIHDATIA